MNDNVSEKLSDFALIFMVAKSLALVGFFYQFITLV